VRPSRENLVLSKLCALVDRGSPQDLADLRALVTGEISHEVFAELIVSTFVALLIGFSRIQPNSAIFGDIRLDPTSQNSSSTFLICYVRCSYPTMSLAFYSPPFHPAYAYARRYQVELLDPKNDAVFKLMLVDDDAADARISLLSAILRPESPIASATVKNPKWVA